MKKIRRKGRLRIDRIGCALGIIIFVILIINIINYIQYNNKVYDSVINSGAKNALIEKKYKKLKIYDKTIKLIKSDDVSVVIKDKNSKTYLSSKNVEKNMNINVDIYNKRLKYKNFPWTKSLFIENKGIIRKSNKVEINLPNYLLSNKYIDIYGVTKDDNVVPVSLKEKAKRKIKIKTDKRYVRYFITFIKLDKIEVSDSTVNKDSIVNLNIKYIPQTATIKDYEYTKIGNIFKINSDGKLVAKKTGTGKVTIKHTIQNIQATATIKVKREENKVEIKNGITYVNGILIANKTYALPKTYNPGKLSDEVVEAFNKMKEAASKDNIKLWIQSGYRSYETQEKLYNGYVNKDGISKADTYSARPGHSEHQTGLAMDLNIIDSSFANTKEGKWIAENCYKYGFIIRYPKGKEDITGYMYEPWHVRYVGNDLAGKIYKSGLTLEEYLGISSKYKD